MVAAKVDMHFLDHLEELRWRLIKCAIAIIVLSIPGFVFWEKIFDVVMIHPLRFANPKPRLIVTSPIEAMMFSIKIGLAVGLILSVPVVFYQLWRFVSPGLYKKEKMMVLPAVIASSGCFLLGVGFCYMVLPYMMGFLGSFASGRMEALYRLDEYLTFIIQLTLSFGLVFELPVIAAVLTTLGLISPRFLIDKFRYAVVIILIVAALLSPPDILSQLVITIPLLTLYGISILISFLIVRRKRR